MNSFFRKYSFIQRMYRLKPVDSVDNFVNNLLSLKKNVEKNFLTNINIQGVSIG